MSDTNPLLAPLANNGGPTQTRSLLPGSPAVDKYTGAECPALDQRAYKRPAGQACDIGAFEASSTRVTDVNSSPLATQGVIGGTLTLIPSGRPSKALRGVDFRPCTGKRHLNEAIAGGYFEAPEGRLAARGYFSFRRDKTRSVRFGNLFVSTDGTTGHVYATVSPTNGAINLFDATSVRYGDEVSTGRLFLTAVGASLLNRMLGLRSFAPGLDCGRFSLHARTVQPPHAAEEAAGDDHRRRRDEAADHDDADPAGRRRRSPSRSGPSTGRVPGSAPPAGGWAARAPGSRARPRARSPSLPASRSR